MREAGPGVQLVRGGGELYQLQHKIFITILTLLEVGGGGRRAEESPGIFNELWKVF